MLMVAILAVNLLVAGALLVTPALSRVDTPLGVHVPADKVDHPVVRSAVRTYRRTTFGIGVAVTLAGVVFALVGDTEPAAAFGLGVLPLLLIALSLVAMVRSRRAVVDARRDEKWFRDVPSGELDDDRHYRWGVFYVNADDPSLFVEKRFGYGVDFNYGHPVGRVIGALLVLLVVGTVGLLVWLAISAV